MDFEELFRRILSLSKEQQIELAKQYVPEVLNYFRQHGGNEHGSKLFIYLLSTYVYANGKVDEEERVFYSKLLDEDIPSEEFKVLVSSGNDIKRINALSTLLASIDKDIRYHAVLIGICMCASKGDLEDQEKILFTNYLLGRTL